MRLQQRIHGSTAPRTAIASMYLGIGSVVAMLLAILGGFMIEALGIITLFRSIVIPLSAAAVATGIIARRKIAQEELSGHNTATIGLALGILVLLLMVLTIVAVALFFTSLLLFA